MFLKFLQSCPLSSRGFDVSPSSRPWEMGNENPLFPAHFVEGYFKIILFADFFFGIWRNDTGFEKGLGMVGRCTSGFFVRTRPCTTQVKMRRRYGIRLCSYPRKTFKNTNG